MEPERRHCKCRTANAATPSARKRLGLYLTNQNLIPLLFKLSYSTNEEYREITG
jgi:hypothetical protein